MGSDHQLAPHDAVRAVVDPPAPVETVGAVPEAVVALPGLATVRRRSSGDDPLGGSVLDPGTERALRSPSGGVGLEPTLRRDMESHLGADLADVRVHTDAPAARLASSVQAEAFTHGDDIFFSAGRYDTESASGQHLLAHELTHVAQRKQGRDAPTPDSTGPGGGTVVGRADDPLEAEADASADRVVGALRRQTRHHGCGCGDHR